MKKIIGLLTLAMISTSASAIQLDFSGEFNYGTGATAAGNQFLGSFDFDLENPDFIEMDGIPTQEVQRLDYVTNASGFAMTNVGQFNSSYIELNFYNNDLNITQPQINDHGFEGLIIPDVYDFVTLAGTTDDVQFDGLTDEVIAGVEFSIIALYEQTTFEQAGFDYNAFFAFTPVFLGFEIQGFVDDGLGGKDAFHGAGIANVSAVPVPAAFWLFGSALAGLVVRTRRQA